MQKHLIYTNTDEIIKNKTMKCAQRGIQINSAPQTQICTQEAARTSVG